jgi:hypothetical protein
MFAIPPPALLPGVYRGGLKIFGDAVVNLKEGEYIIKDGPLLVSEKAQLHGKNVGFFMAGKLEHRTVNWIRLTHTHRHPGEGRVQVSNSDINGWLDPGLRRDDGPGVDFQS